MSLPSTRSATVRDVPEGKTVTLYLIKHLCTGNHLGYKQAKGRKTPAEEVAELYAGLKQAFLTDFDVMLSGYCPSAEVVAEVGKIAREKRLASTTRPGTFFWGLSTSP